MYHQKMLSAMLITLTSCATAAEKFMAMDFDGDRDCTVASAMGGTSSYSWTTKIKSVIFSKYRIEKGWCWQISLKCKTTRKNSPLNQAVKLTLREIKKARLHKLNVTLPLLQVSTKKFSKFVPKGHGARDAIQKMDSLPENLELRLFGDRCQIGTKGNDCIIIKFNKAKLGHKDCSEDCAAACHNEGFKHDDETEETMHQDEGKSDTEGTDDKPTFQRQKTREEEHTEEEIAAFIEMATASHFVRRDSIKMEEIILPKQDLSRLTRAYSGVLSPTEGKTSNSSSLDVDDFMTGWGDIKREEEKKRSKKNGKKRNLLERLSRTELSY